MIFQKTGTTQVVRTLKQPKSTQAIMTVLPSLETYFEWISVKLKSRNLRYQNPYRIPSTKFLENTRDLWAWRTFKEELEISCTPDSKQISCLSNRGPTLENAINLFITPNSKMDGIFLKKNIIFDSIM